MRPGLALCLPAAAAAACVDPLTSNAMCTPEWDLKNTVGYAQTATGQRPDVVFG